MPERHWIKSSFSMGLNACVELAQEGGSVLVRNSRHPDVVLCFTPAEVEAFLKGQRNGEFDVVLDAGSGAAT